MDAEELLTSATDILSGISKINSEQYKQRIDKKENFNFFSAIVSGKNDRQHIEKYHSNFIGYLLDPKSSHDFGGLFLKLFFKELRKAPFNIDNFPDENSLTFEREKLTSEGRLIDIALEEKGEWLVFIENKIRSGELKGQIKDYCSFAENNYKNSIGIYLTLDGSIPLSIDPIKNTSTKIICMSYLRIIQWLKICSQHHKVAKHPHVVNALNQYIAVINQILKNMEVDKNNIIEYLKINKDKTAKLIAGRFELAEALDDLTIIVRDKFREDLSRRLNERKVTEMIPAELKIEISQGAYFVSKGECYGLGLEIKKGEEKFHYGGKGFQGYGNGIHINGIDAHNEIDLANEVLFRVYDNSEEWNKLIDSTSDQIMEEIKFKVLPKFNS